LGEFGWNNLFLSPEYGPRQRIGSIITDASLVPDPLYNGPPLCDRCMECVKACGGKALSKELLPPGKDIVRIENKKYTYAKMNRWRCIWAEQYALDHSLIPDKVNEKVIFEFLQKPGTKLGVEFGNCLRYCMPPHLRYADPDYCRVYRRKKKHYNIQPSKLTENVESLAMKEGAHLIGVVPLQELKNVPVDVPEGYPWETVLKYFKNVVIFGINHPITSTSQLVDGKLPVQLRDASNYIHAALRQLMQITQIDICRYLDSLGYEAMQTWDDVQNLTKSGVKILGWDKFEDKKYYFNSLLTTAPLKRLK